MISVTHQIPRDDVLLGIIRAQPVQTAIYPPDFESRLQSLIRERAHELSDRDEQRRRAARDILRNGQYRPTGRSKPASEYLLRVAGQDPQSFPRINAPVDVSNYVSLRYILPISLWDLERAESSSFVFRLGRPNESYPFNEAGQEIDLTDLLVGCRVRDRGDQTPIVNPVKDCAVTKTTPSTHHIASCIYAPGAVVSNSDLTSICDEFAALLRMCGRDVTTSSCILVPGETATV